MIQNRISSFCKADFFSGYKPIFLTNILRYRLHLAPSDNKLKPTTNQNAELNSQPSRRQRLEPSIETTNKPKESPNK